MIQKSEYLAWALRQYGRARYDLASSGIAPLSQSELAAIPIGDGTDGWARLRGAIAAYHGVSPAEVVGALGASHGLRLAYMAMLDDGDEVLAEDPAYEPVVAAAEAAGAVVRRFDRGLSRGFALDPECVFAALTDRTRVVAVTNHHNPSGMRASDEALAAIARRMEERGGFLFVDEIYAPFDGLAGPDGTFAGTARRLGPNVVTTGSLTKAYGLGAARIGWVVGPEAVIERAIDALIAEVGTLPVQWMHAGASAFEHVASLAERSRSLLGTKRERVGRWIAAHDAIAWSNPSEGLFGLATIPSAGDLRPVIEAGIERHDVIVVPGGFFGVPNAFRLAWALPEDELDDALDRLGRMLGEAGLI
jgi:hypothetical protein